jgi:hypothetical protein
MLALKKAVAIPFTSTRTRHGLPWETASRTGGYVHTLRMSSVVTCEGHKVPRNCKRISQFEFPNLSMPLGMGVCRVTRKCVSGVSSHALWLRNCVALLRHTSRSRSRKESPHSSLVVSSTYPLLGPLFWWDAEFAALAVGIPLPAH